MYLWGNGRYGQLAGMGTNLMLPTLAPSLLQTQQVSNVLTQDTDFVLDCYSFLICLSLCGYFHCHSGCVWTELFFPGPVQWDSTSCRRRTIWQTGPGEFWWSLCPHYYLCFSRYSIHPGPRIHKSELFCFWMLWRTFILASNNVFIYNRKEKNNCFHYSIVI